MAAPMFAHMEKTDIIILGSGLVGLTLAIALETHGLRVQVVDPLDPARALEEGFDGRASAIASASWRMLEAIGVAPHLEGKGCAIRRIEVRDGLQKVPMDFTVASDEEPLGTMVENRALRTALWARAQQCANLEVIAPAKAAQIDRGEHGVTVTLESGRILSAPLLVAAEGRQSPTREAAGIRTAKWQYDHVAIISAFDHATPHNNVAHEIFYPAGPFALLPLQPGTRSALVWTVAKKDAPGVLALSDRAFLAEVTKRTGGLLGELSPAAPRAGWPLGFHHAARITAHRLALIGDAAHGIHPIAGQGLNLGLRDVAALTEVLIDGARLGLDLADTQLMTRYERWRSLDALMLMVSTDSLTRLFGLPGAPSRLIRRTGLAAVQRIPVLKRRFMAEARGTTGALPKLLQGLAA